MTKKSPCDCDSCPLKAKWGKEKVTVYQNRRRVGEAAYCEVPFRGPTKNVEIVVVGESPGTVEILHKKPFVGDSGEVVAAEFRANKLDPASVFYANSCRCMLSADDKKDKKRLQKAMACCRPAVANALRALKPKLVIVFGDVALQQVLKQSGITSRRGRFQWSEEFQCWVMPAFHPAFCLRDQKQFALWRPDIAQAVQFWRDGCTMGANDARIFADVDSIRFLLDQKDLTVGLDTETQGKNWPDPTSVVISYSVSPTPDSGYNVWLAQEVETREEADLVIQWPRKSGRTTELVDVFVKKAPDYDRRVAELRELCLRPDIKIVMMNGNYDLHRLRQLGIPREEVVSYTLDIQLAMHTLDPDMFKQTSLRDIQAALVPHRIDHKAAFKQDVDMNDMLAAAKADPRRHVDYACGDTAVTLECATVLRRRLLDDRRLANYYARLAHPVTTEVLYDIEKNGMRFDLERLPHAKEEVAALLRQRTDEFFALCPPKVIEKHRDKGLRLTRAEILKDALFSRQGFGLRPLESTPGGEASTNRKVLIRMRDDLQDGDAKELLNAYIAWGPYQKLYSTYLKGFEEAVWPDGRLHTQIAKTGTATGRTSSARPNLQNIPKRNPDIKRIIRSLMVADPGTVLVTIDYSQSELRWVAHESQDPVYMQVYRDGQDIHETTAKMLVRMQGVDPDSLSKEELKPWRTKAKAVNFGLIYGMQAKKFQAYARDEYGVRLTIEEAERFHRGFFQLYRALPAWHARRIEEARKNGFVRTAYGNIRRTPSINCDDLMKRGEDERLAINTPIQAASNDSALFAALQARRRGICDDNLVKLVLFVHDELVYQVAEDHVDTFVPQILECMEHPPLEQYFGIRMSVPLVAEAQIGTSLANLSDYKRS